MVTPSSPQPIQPSAELPAEPDMQIPDSVMAFYRRLFTELMQLPREETALGESEPVEEAA